MKKLNSLLLFILLLTQTAYSQNDIQISILTCATGREVYSIFGHSAIRVIDRCKNTDKIYNFGMFDFETPNFKYKFLKGKLKYHLGVQPTDDFIKIYTGENRMVSEQVLHLTSADKIKVLNKLTYLYQPENRYYLYSFLHKNCATEIRDILGEIGVTFNAKELKVSNRQLINYYLLEKPWLRFGINLILGTSLDKNSNQYQRMFLPKYLENELNHSELHNTKLVKSMNNLNSSPIQKISVKSPVNYPLFIFSAILLFFLWRFPKPFQLMICLIIGLTGTFLLALWICSGHEEVQSNFNVIWCSPFYLLHIPLLIKNQINQLLSLFLMVTIISSLIIWILEIQVFDIAILPILGILWILNFKGLKTDHLALGEQELI